MEFGDRADIQAIEAEMPWESRDVPRSIHALLCRTKDKFGARPAVSFQLSSDPQAYRVTRTWDQIHDDVTRTANLFHQLGIGRDAVVAYLLPNMPETVVTLLAGAVAGIVNPVNPLLEPARIAALLRESRAKVVVTLKGLPGTDLAQKVAVALQDVPDVKTVIEIDLARYLSGFRRLLVPLVRPRIRMPRHVQVLSFHDAVSRQPGDRLLFDDPAEDRVAACFHTGGTTGLPRLARHQVSGMIYNGWLGASLLFTADDVVMCPLPLFHVFAAYPVLMSMVAAGGHMVLPTPAGYRGKDVIGNFWKLIERYRCTYLMTVPTAIAALMQHRVDADVSTLRMGFSGSAPMPVELYNRFHHETGVEILEGYGLTECTCLVAVNPPQGRKKIGSVGLPFPYTRVRIMKQDGQGGFTDAKTDEIGEICVSSPGVHPGETYADPSLNRDLFIDGRFLRTGDLGRLDPDGYLWITGRAKDLIIRGGNNIDPALIEDVLNAHPSVAIAGAIGEPDARSGELPAVYVELVRGKIVSTGELLEFCRQNISERAAIPKYLEILPEMPKTAIGKVYKPALRKLAIARVYDAALAKAGLPVTVAEVAEDKVRGLVARLTGRDGADAERVRAVLGDYTIPWEWKE